MLIEINLLPKKSPKNMANMITIFIIVLLLAMGIAYFYYRSVLIEADTANLSMQKEAVVAERAELEAEIESIQAENEEAATQQEVVDVILDTVHTTKIVTEAKKHLPSNASIAGYTYTEGAAMTFEILVEKSSHVGSFIEGLNTIGWVKQASLVSSTYRTDSEKYLGIVDVTLDREALIN